MPRPWRRRVTAVPWLAFGDQRAVSTQIESSMTAVHKACERSAASPHRPRVTPETSTPYIAACLPISSRGAMSTKICCRMVRHFCSICGLFENAFSAHPWSHFDAFTLTTLATRCNTDNRLSRFHPITPDIRDPRFYRDKNRMLRYIGECRPLAGGRRVRGARAAFRRFARHRDPSGEHAVRAAKREPGATGAALYLARRIRWRGSGRRRSAARHAAAWILRSARHGGRDGATLAP